MSGTDRISSLAAEPEVDLWRLLGRLWGRLPVLALFALAGLVGGYVAWRVERHDFQARTVLFVTQTGALAQPQSLGVIARSRSVLVEAAARTGVSAQRLAESISATRVGSGASTRTFQFQVSVRGRPRKAILAASNAIAAAVLDRIDDYQRAQVASAEAQLAEADGLLAAARRREVLARSLIRGNRIVGLTALGLIQQSESITRSRIGQLRVQLAQAVAQRSQIISSSVASTGARSRTLSGVVGAVIGLILGLFVALAQPERAGGARREEAA